MILTKKCTICNKIISIDHFRNNKNDKFFKTCYYCREKYKNKKLKVINSDMLNSNILNKNTILTIINRNLFTRNILLYIFELNPNIKVLFKKPELDKYAMILCFNDSTEINIKYGISWNILKNLLVKKNTFILSSINSIIDDTIVDSINIDIFIEKIRNLVPDEKIKTEIIKPAEHISIYFIDRYSTMSLQIGDSWRNVYRFIKESKGRRIEAICPICMELKNKDSRMTTCHNCLKHECIECFITLFIKNEGLIICPYCRYTIGQKMSQYEVKYIADGMMNKAYQLSIENYI